MLDARRRPRGRFFYCLISVLWIWGITHAPVAAAGTAPATTEVSDVVYRADSTPASGVALISWPAFTTADGQPVAAGSTSVPLGTDGSFSVALVPNAGATPAGAYYTVVFQLDEAVSNREIVDEVKFKEGLSKVIDGTVECLNASSWARAKP